MRLHRPVRVYTCQNATLLEITCRASAMFGSYFFSSSINLIFSLRNSSSDSGFGSLASARAAAGVGITTGAGFGCGAGGSVGAGVGAIETGGNSGATTFTGGGTEERKNKC